MAAHPVLCTLLIGRLPALAPTDPLAVALDQVALTPLREILESGVASGGFTLDDAEVTAYALYGAISIAALSRLTRGGHIDAGRLEMTLIPLLVASVTAPTPASRVT